jgi:peptidoglycan/LPS O-acetylase OafA/YrhL
MSLRFLTNAVLALLGATLVVFSMAVSAHAAGWIAFGTSIAIISVLGLIQPARGRGIPQRGLDLAVVISAAAMIATSLFYTGVTLTWLVFGFGVLYVGLANLGLGLHEIRTEHVVHELAPSAEREREREREYAELK